MMKQADKRNLSMIMDLYELTMANGYFNDGDTEARVAFDVFYRKNPDRGGFTILRDLNRLWSMWKTCTFPKKMWRICVRFIHLRMRF